MTGEISGRHQLKDKNIRQRDPAEGALFRTEERIAVLPKRLQSAERPAESLANQGAGGFRGFGPGDGFFIVADAPAETANPNGEIRVFGDGIRGDAAGRFDCLFSPRAQTRQGRP